MASNKTIKWAILGCGKISADFVSALKVLEKGKHEVVAAGAQNLARAKEFALTFGIPNAYGSYEEGASHAGDFDVVYIGALNHKHYDATKLMLEAGKHVLCEKTFCMNPREAAELIQLAKKKKLFLMEAIWSRCFPAYKEIRRLICSGEIGDVILLQANFGIQFTAERVLKKSLGGGVIFDIGVYLIQLAILIFGLKPETIKSIGTVNSDGVDDECHLILQYPDGKTANLLIHGRVKTQNIATIYGSKGTIVIPDPLWCPKSITVNGEVKNFPLPESNCEFHYNNSVGLSYEAEEVRRCLIEGLAESPLLTHEETMAIANIQAEALKQLGIKY